LPEHLFLRKTWSLWTHAAFGTAFGTPAFAFQRKLAQRHPADVGESDGQAGLPFGTALSRAHRDIALGVYRLARATPPRVALRGPLGRFPRVDDQRVLKTLTWPWWSLEGLLSQLAPLENGRLRPSVGVFVLTPQ